MTSTKVILIAPLTMTKCSPSPAFAPTLLARPPPAIYNGASPLRCLERLNAGQSTARVASPFCRRRYPSVGIRMMSYPENGSGTPDASSSSSTTPESGADESSADAAAGGVAEVDDTVGRDDSAAAARAAETRLRDALRAVANDADQLQSDQEALTEERLFMLKMKREMHPDDWRRIFNPNDDRIGDFM